MGSAVELQANKIEVFDAQHKNKTVSRGWMMGERSRTTATETPLLSFKATDLSNQKYPRIAGG